MIVKIFKTIGPKAYFTSIFLLISTVLFSFLLDKNWAQLLDQWPILTVEVIFIFTFITMITLLEIKIKGRKFDGIYFIAFPTIFLFFPTFIDIKIIPTLQLILLTYGQYVFIKIIHSKNTEKWILDLSLIISVIAQFNYFFLVFYLLLLFVFLKRSLKDAKNLLALFLPILVIPFTFNSISIILPSKILDHLNPLFQMKLLNIQLLTNADKVWLITLLFTVAVCVIQLIRGYRKFLNAELFSSYLYMTFWLLFSIAFGFLGLQTTSQPWFFSLIPVAYFFGGFIENMKLDLSKNIFFTIFFLGIVFFKLFDNGIISLELPFLN